MFMDRYVLMCDTFVTSFSAKCNQFQFGVHPLISHLNKVKKIVK